MAGLVGERVRARTRNPAEAYARTTDNPNHHTPLHSASASRTASLGHDSSVALTLCACGSDDCDGLH